jgi:hypothetical protein
VERRRWVQRAPEPVGDDRPHPVKAQMSSCHPTLASTAFRRR